MDDPVFGELKVTGLPARFSANPRPEVEPTPPHLGRDNAAVLSELLDLDDDAVAELVERGVVVAHPPLGGS